MASINEYRNRMTAPIGAVRIDPKTGKKIVKDNGNKGEKSKKGK